jgi:hypothetical protein
MVPPPDVGDEGGTQEDEIDSSRGIGNSINNVAGAWGK